MLLDKVLVEFAEQNYIARSVYRPILTAIRNNKLSKLDQYRWFVLYDALGCDDLDIVENNQELRLLYNLAKSNYFKLIKERV